MLKLILRRHLELVKYSAAGPDLKKKLLLAFHTGVYPEVGHLSVIGHANASQFYHRFGAVASNSVQTVRAAQPRALV